MRTITITTTGGVGAFVTGRDARRLLRELTGRVPVSASSGFATTAKRVPDLVALAESRGYRVVVLDEGEVGTDV